MSATTPVKRACRVGLFGACAALSLCAASIARAVDQPGIVIVADHADASITATLRAELTALGLQAQLVPPGEHEMSPSELTEVARQNQASAAFRVLVEEHKVEVWLADRVTGKLLLREVLMSKDAGQSPAEESAVVARAVELLRASLLELDIDNRPRGDAPAPAALPPKIQPPQITVPLATREHVSRYGIAVGFELLAASTHAALSSGLSIGGQLNVTRGWALLARTTVPFSGATYSAAQGRADVSPRWASLGLRYRIGEWPHRWQIWLDSGVGLLLTDSVGIAGAGYLARSTFDVDPVAYAGAEVTYSLSRPVAISFGLLGGPGLRPTKILFDDQVIDHYGRWLVISQAGLNLTWD